MGVRIDARTSREYQAAALAIRSVDRTLRKQIRVHTKRVAQPEWQRALDKRATTEQQRKVIARTAVVMVTDRNVRVQAAKKGRPLGGGLNPKVHGRNVEHGATVAQQRVQRKWASYELTTGRGLPPRNRDGYVFWAAARDMVPRMFALWAQTTVRTIANALEGRED